MLVIFFRALILYLVIFLIFRIMGKRELSKVQPFELVVMILMADLASAPMSSRGISILDGIVPIFTLLLCYIVFTFLTKMSTKVQEGLCGKNVIIIKDGKLLEKEFRNQEYTVADIMSQLREKDVFKIQDVKYGILETNGNLNVITMDKQENGIPLNIIEDGKKNDINMQILNMTDEKLDKIIAEKNVKLEDILVGTIDERGNFIFQKKGEK
ncbi:MAG: DUF421 domain-containing protein [Clostridia bacterium]|nr:DUF421 domain-containing protein [Clostridia bacterium]